MEIWRAIRTLNRAVLSILVFVKSLKDLAAIAVRCVVLVRGSPVWSGAPAGLTWEVTDRWLGV
jgi:ABC-type branched-subunit amino acid transport system ATPase component